MLTSATVYLQDKAAVLAQQWCATMTKKYDDEQCVGRSLTIAPLRPAVAGTQQAALFSRPH